MKRHNQFTMFTIINCLFICLLGFTFSSPVTGVLIVLLMYLFGNIYMQIIALIANCKSLTPANHKIAIYENVEKINDFFRLSTWHPYYLWASSIIATACFMAAGWGTVVSLSFITVFLVGTICSFGLYVLYREPSSFGV